MILVTKLIFMIMFVPTSTLLKVSMKRFFRAGNKPLSSVQVAPRDEYIVVNKDSHYNIALSLKVIRPNLKILKKKGESSSCTWMSYRNELCLDSTVLEPMYEGKNSLSDSASAAKWNDIIDKRMTVFETPLELNQNNHSFEEELTVAKAIVQKACFVSRTLQHILQFNKCGDSLQTTSVSKEDKSPVTIADFAVQALIINRISEAFPSDAFIAEENSEIVRHDKRVCDGVLKIMMDATGEEWSRDRLIATLDKGISPSQTDNDDPVNSPISPQLSTDRLPRRVWVLDPIDGTKGFIRGAHFCVALALLVDGVPQLSVLGCPNLSVDKILNRGNDHVAHVESVGAVDTPFAATPNQIEEVVPATEASEALDSLLRSLSGGSMYFAVTGQGAFARSLTMPLDAGYEVSVSGQSVAVRSLLCAAYEKAHGNEALSERVARTLKLPSNFIRIDSQCKYCVVGSGAAEATLRLPPAGYREKIWDHAPGTHFVTEAGGRVTDLKGRPLDFSAGNLLDSDVDGIVVSNGHLHDQIVLAVRSARSEEAFERASLKE
jgi:3'(2'), 5'-bisphosphate nucleotidase